MRFLSSHSSPSRALSRSTLDVVKPIRTEGRRRARPQVPSAARGQKSTHAQRRGFSLAQAYP